MIIEKGIFKKTKYEVKGKVLHKSVHPFFGLFHSKKKDESLDLTEVEYIYSFPLGLIKHGVEFVTESESMYIPGLTKQQADDLISAAKYDGAKEGEHQYMFVPSSRALRKIYHGYSMVCDQFGKMVHKEYTKKENNENLIRMESIKYFDHVAIKGVKGIAFGGIAGGGIANTIEIFGLKKEDNAKIYQMIAAVNPKLTDTNVKIYTSLFPLWHPTRWFRKRESMIVADWGIVHKQYNIVINKKKCKSRTSVVEFDSIKSYTCQGFLYKRIDILGSTSIITQECFSAAAKNAIWATLKKHNVINDSGTVYRASALYRWGILSKGKDKDNKNKAQDKMELKCRIFASDSCLTWKYKKETRILTYAQIYEYEFEKKHWYSLVGKVKIKGRRNDARAGEGGDVNMSISCICCSKGRDLISTISSKKGS